MTRRRLTVMGGAATLALGAAIAAPMAARADYPPDQGIGVSLSPLRGNQLDVTVTNVPDHCQVRVSSRNHDEYAYDGRITSGTATIPNFTVGWKAGVYVIRVQTYGGGCKKKQTVTTKVVITKNKLAGPKSVRAGQSFTVNATGWLPNSNITFTISKGSFTESLPSTKTDNDGNASQTISIPTPGTWAVVVTQDGGPMKFYSVQVLPQRRPHRHHG